MSSNFPQDQKPSGMDSAVVSDSSLQVSNLLRRFANPTQPQVPSKLGLSPLSLRERLLTHDLGGGSNLASQESRSSSDMSIPFDPELQSIWEITAHQQQQQPQQQHQQQQPQQYEGSPLNPNNLNNQDALSLRQMQLRQQLGVMAAALLPRSGSVPPTAGTDSVGSGDSRLPSKRRWADCLAEANSLPSSTPSSPPRPTPPLEGNTQSLLGLPSSAGNEDNQGPMSGGSGGADARRKDSALVENSSEWEPRVRRKKQKGSSNNNTNNNNNGTDDEACASDGDGVVRIKAKSMTERQRRDRISDALRRLRGAVNSHGDMATMLNEAVDLIQQQKRRIEELEMQILQQRLRQQLAGGCRTLF